MIKTEEKKPETSKLDEVEPKGSSINTHRYVCEACTGVAFYNSSEHGIPDMICCQVCNITNFFKKENLIKL